MSSTARERYEAFIKSLAYAYAMGSSCSNPDHPIYQEVRDAADRLLMRAQLEEGAKDD